MHDVTLLFSHCKTMETLTPATLIFRGDEAVPNINQSYGNFAGFVFTPNLTL